MGDGRHRAPTAEGKVYLAAVLDAFSRRVVGWSIADHVRAGLVVDAVQMPVWRRRPPEGQTVAHSDHGSQYTSWAFGRRLRSTGLLGSHGIGRRLLRQLRGRELLRHAAARAPRRAPLVIEAQLALAIFDWIEAWYNPKRRHSYCRMLSPIDYEAAQAE